MGTRQIRSKISGGKSDKTYTLRSGSKIRTAWTDQEKAQKSLHTFSCEQLETLLSLLPQSVAELITGWSMTKTVSEANSRSCAQNLLISASQIRFARLRAPPRRGLHPPCQRPPSPLTPPAPPPAGGARPRVRSYTLCPGMLCCVQVASWCFDTRRVVFGGCIVRRHILRLHQAVLTCCVSHWIRHGVLTPGA